MTLFPEFCHFKNPHKRVCDQLCSCVILRSLAVPVVLCCACLALHARDLCPFRVSLHVGLLKPDWLSGGTYVGVRDVDGFQAREKRQREGGG